MPTLNVSRVVNNPKFAEEFTITRSMGGSFDNTGTWIDNTMQITGYGVIQPARSKELLQVPEADRVKEVKSFHTQLELRVSHADSINDNNQGTSDIITWQSTGEQYRLVYLYPWEDFGYFKALGVRIQGS